MIGSRIRNLHNFARSCKYVAGTRAYHRGPLLAGILTLCVMMLPMPAGASIRNHSQSSTHLANSRLRWMLTGANISKLSTLDPGLAQSTFNNSATLALASATGLQNQVPSGYKSVPTLIFQSYATFLDDLTAGQIAPGIKAVVYDPEDWPSTPVVEQQNPTRYLRDFALLAHKYGYLVIETPARDLMGVPGAKCTSNPGESYDQAYLRCAIAPAAARWSNVIVVQAQADEFNVAQYEAFVQLATQQARLVSPSVQVLAGLSSGPSSGVASSAQLLAAAQSVRSLVTGYWLNAFASRPGQLQSTLGFLQLIDTADRVNRSS
jgi:hypothetical protein